MVDDFGLNTVLEYSPGLQDTIGYNVYVTETDSNSVGVSYDSGSRTKFHYDTLSIRLFDQGNKEFVALDTIPIIEDFDHPELLDHQHFASFAMRDLYSHEKLVIRVHAIISSGMSTFAIDKTFVHKRRKTLRCPGIG